MQLRENTIFDDRYVLIHLLGRGGFSEVWLAKDKYTKLDLAIKVYAPGQGMEANGLADFSTELAGVFNLNHTNLLKPTHVDVWENMPYLIVPYCSRGSVAKYVGEMSEEEIWRLIRDVAAGLAYLHKNDVVHQDIKPDNILIDEAGNYVITDFGISTKARSTLRKSVIGNVSGGTMDYMGPERFSKQPAPTKASDIWSLGATLFELLEGNTPYGDLGGGMQKGGAEIPEITANVSAGLKEVIYKMLSKETWDRPTAEQLINWKPVIEKTKEIPKTLTQKAATKPKQHLWGLILHGWHTGVYALLSLIGFIGVWSNRHMFPDYMGALHYFICILELYFITAFIANILICLHKKYGYVLYQISTFIMYMAALISVLLASVVENFYSGDIEFIYMSAIFFSIPVLGSSISLYAHYQGTPFYELLGIPDMKKYRIYLLLNIGFILGFVLLFFFSPMPG